MSKQYLAFGTDIGSQSFLDHVVFLYCRYGGAEKFEQVIFILADNLADEDISFKVSIKLK